MKRVIGLLFRLVEYAGRYDQPVHWCAQLSMLLAASPFFVGAGLSLSSGLGPLADVVLFVSLMWIACWLAGLVAGALLSLLPARLPYRMIGNGIALYTALIVIFRRTDVGVSGAAAVAGTALLTAYLAGSGLWLLFRGGKKRRFAAAGYAGLGAASFLLFHAWMFGGATDASARGDWQTETPYPIRAAGYPDDPSAFGPYRVQSFTYGSGFDPYRPEFAEEAAIRTSTADGSALVDSWGWSRRWLWDADPSALPINGRVWMPVDGPEEGPYPLVLIMHGNHQMADYSDEGYAYLGELLASRGYLTVSVDANFLNHSTWEGNLGEGGENIAIRAWLLLKHLQEIESLTQTDGNLLSGKADMNRIALIGHSRGGQAVMLAAGFDDFFAGEKHAAIRIGRDFAINAVIALAPTDFPVDNRAVPAGNVNYLLLQGANDADVTNFSGDRQYNRIAFDSGQGRFFLKASLYIEGANHGQFNEDWERRDISYPAAWLLNGWELLSGEEQRQIARVYISAFLDTALRGSDRYLPMFRDYRHALAWLPDTGFISRYSDSRFVPLLDFEDDLSRKPGGFSPSFKVFGNESWREIELKNRYGDSRLTRVAELVWKEEKTTVTIELPEEDLWPDGRGAEALGLSLADLSGEEGELEVAVEVETRDGKVLRAELDDKPPVPCPVETSFLKPFPGDLLEEAVKDGELETSRETVLQSYYLSIGDDVSPKDDSATGPETAAVSGDPGTSGEVPDTARPFSGIPLNGADALRLREIEEIRIMLEREDGGAVLLDDIGLYVTE